MYSKDHYIYKEAELWMRKSVEGVSRKHNAKYRLLHHPDFDVSPLNIALRYPKVCLKSQQDMETIVSYSDQHWVDQTEMEI